MADLHRMHLAVHDAAVASSGSGSGSTVLHGGAMLAELFGGPLPFVRTDAQYSWLFGVFLAALASIISNLGLTLQKLTHQRIASGYDRSNRPYYQHALWIVGLSFVIFASAADVIALCFAPQSLVAPLGALTMVSNVVFAPLLLHERIGLRDLLATTVILAGSIVAVAFGSHDDVIYSIDELFGLFWQWSFAGYSLMIVAGLAGFLYYVHTLVEIEERFRNGQGADLSDSQRQWQRFAYPALAGTIGAQSVLFAKCTVELVLNTGRHQGNAFVHWQTYLIIFALCSSIFLQVKWLNEGLQRFDSSYIVPVFVSFWIILSVASGMVFFKEYHGMSWTQIWLFFLGVLCTIMGVILLSFRPIASSSANAGRGTDLFDGVDENDTYARGGSPYPSRRRLSVEEREAAEALREKLKAQQAADEEAFIQRRVREALQEKGFVSAHQVAGGPILSGSSHFRQPGGAGAFQPIGGERIDSSPEDVAASADLIEDHSDDEELAGGERRGLLRPGRKNSQ